MVKLRTKPHLKRQRNRRQLLPQLVSSSLKKTWLGASLVSGVMAVDIASQMIFWPRNETEVISGLTSNGQPRWLALPGLGKSSGEFIRDTLGGCLPGTIDYLQLSSRGISAKKVGQALARYYQSYYPGGRDTQYVMAHSMGLPTFLMGVEWCRKHGTPVPPIGTLLAFSSPVNPAHTFHEKFIRAIRRYPYPGGVLSKFGVEFYQRSYAHEFQLTTLGEAALGALKSSFQECAPALWSSQIRTLGHRDLYPPEVLEGIITPDTQVYHFGDPDDIIVNVPAARRDFADVVRRYGADLTVIEMPGEGHANMLRIKERLRQLPALSAVRAQSV